MECPASNPEWGPNRLVLEHLSFVAKPGRPAPMNPQPSAKVTERLASDLEKITKLKNLGETAIIDTENSPPE